MTSPIYKSLMLCGALACLSIVDARANEVVPTPNPANPPGLANPASVNCNRLKGELSLLKTTPAGNEVGVCSFGAGSVEEWTLYRWQIQHMGQKAVQAYLDTAFSMSVMENPLPGMPNPASTNCQRAGGKLQLVHDAQGELGLCKFSDDSSIEEWTLFYGPYASRNADLTAALGQ